MLAPKIKFFNLQKTVRSSCTKALDTKVNKLVQEGWTVSGPIVVETQRYDVAYIQQVIKPMQAETKKIDTGDIGETTG